MSLYTIPDGVLLQTAQNTSDTFILGSDDTLVSAGADLVFASGADDTVYDTGIARAANGTYQGDMIVLGTGEAKVIVGGAGSIIEGGTGHADIFYPDGTAGSLLVTGRGNLDVVGNPNGIGIDYGGGVVSVTHDTTGFTVDTGLHSQVHVWAAGPLG